MSRLRELSLLAAVALERPALARRALARLLRDGDLPGLWLRALHTARSLRPAPLAERYFQLDAPSLAALTRRARRIEGEGPLISVITPFHHTPPTFLRAAIASVLDQPYRRLELILVDDAGRPTQALRQALLAAGRDRRVRVLRQPAHGGVSAATNAGLAAARGELCAFLDHDDELTPDALTVVAERFLADPSLDAAYSDQFKVDDRGEIIDHQFKPDWSPVHLLGVMYLGHLLTVRTTAARTVGGCDPAMDGVQDFDLVLRLHEAGAKIGHIALPLYKWRACPGSLAADAAAKPDIPALQGRAVAAHLERRGLTWAVQPHPRHGGRHRLLLAPRQRRRRRR